jgi:GH43 family beta-xylosidase
MVYHARPYEKITGNPLYDPNRHAMFMKLGWSEDGMPLFKY